jgi:multicomponent Na+:H+ antiporter subunit D
MIDGGPSTVLAILVPLTASVLAVVAPGRARPAIAIAGTAATLTAVVLVAAALYEGAPWRYEVGGWGAPVGIDLYVDGLAVALLLLTAVVGLLVTVYAAAYYRDGEAGDRGGGAFWPLWLFALTSVNALYLSADVFNLYVTLELLGVSAVGLVLIGGGTAALSAALRYLLVAFAGSMAFLMGVAFIYAATGTLDLYGLAPVDGGEGAIVVALALMTVGLLLKSGMFPLHFWLPAAHAIAPSPVSPILSALVVKASAYLVLRLWLQGMPEGVSTAGATALGVLGVAGIAWGSFEALRQDHLKRLIAYSTVAQLGYLLLAVPLIAAAQRGTGGALSAGDAWFGAAYVALAHGVAKAALFMCAGILIARFGASRLTEIRGVAEVVPITAFAFGLATFTLIGLPPSAGFAGKWHLLQASLDLGQWWWALPIALGGLLTGAYLLRASWFFFRGVQDATVDALGNGGAPASRTMEIVAFLTALLGLLLGLRTVEAYELVRLGAPLGGIG